MNNINETYMQRHSTVYIYNGVSVPLHYRSPQGNIIQFNRITNVTPTRDVGVMITSPRTNRTNGIRE